MSPKPNEYAFPLRIRDYAAAPLPCMEEWKTLWKAWDLVTTKMIPAEALMEQPIPLRNPLKFYVGHIPTLATGLPPTDPASYAQYFERGIDPDVDDPSQCHDHSELPTVWPDLGEMLDYRDKVKGRIRSMYDTGRAYGERRIGRALWIGYEHEGESYSSLHLETFLYMTILSPNIKPPPGIPRPDFESMAQDAASARVENEWFRIPEQELTIGYQDPESDDGPNRFFAWDNEREPYDVRVPAFEAKARPVCVGEFAAFLVGTGRQEAIPATWVRRQATLPDRGNALQTFVSQHGIRTVWGPIPLSQALDWPAMASYDDMTMYCAWLGGGVRIPTLHQVRSIHEFSDRRRAKSSSSSEKNKTAHTEPEAIFSDLDGANVGLQNFHPVPVTHKGATLCGLGDLGGAWEWSSTPFAPQPGFKPMAIYPGYSGEFLSHPSLNRGERGYE
ncbi:hypothetical protein XA68_13559 [Ophiocordyceps unilateralis]|uniref:Sulfatase-modifying factor enzyme-like domain-containing protein n=1 Tax=Ophiocordyceps unilateralis TaxID=268505 RepID=A0A2A9PCH6_OPHUN|nr:hypothetical protein XA68_13559 [Ophiocordyceps unilateralis]